MRKIEPWRVITGLAAVSYIVYMWLKKDIASVYSTLPKEEAIPLIATTAAVFLVKVAAIAGAVLLIRWIIEKIKKK